MRSSICVLFVALLLSLLRPAAAQTTIFADEFNSGKLSSAWKVYGTDRSLSRTIFGNKPLFATEAGTKYMRLRLDTYNAQYPGSYLSGTEIHTAKQFTVGNGVEIVARLRAPNLSPGIVWAFFVLGERGVWPDTYARDEIDFEHLSSLPNNQLWTNIFNDVNRNTQSGNSRGFVSTTPPVNRNEWNIYKIRWYPDRVEWWINTGSGDVLIRTESDLTVIPDDSQSVRFNIWASDPSWTIAYGDLPVTSDKTQNTSYYMDVDYVRMTSIGPRGKIGNGDGLKAEYFDNADFTAPVRTQVDRTVNFSWLNSPLLGVGEDTFSVRWTGQLQAEYSETYTVHVTADDGVRLWVNNNLLIDQWGYKPNNEYSASIALKAGQKYAIKMEFFDSKYGATAQLRWSSKSTPKYIIPRTQLYSLYKPPSDSILPSAIIASPIHTYSYRSLSQALGSASDNIGVTYVTARLHRIRDNTYWTGYTWGPYSTTEVAVKGTSEWTNWTFPMPTLSDGMYALRISAKDAAGNTGMSPITEFYIDSTAPQVTLTQPAANVTHNSSLTEAKGTAGDAVGVAEVRVVLQRSATGQFWEGSDWTTDWTENLANGTTNWTYSMPDLTPGEYVIWAIATDWVGNRTMTVSRSFTVE